MEVDTFDNDYKLVGGKRLKSYEVDYSSLSQKQIEDKMKGEVDYISGLCGVDVSIVMGDCSCDGINAAGRLMSRAYCSDILTGTARSLWTSTWTTRMQLRARPELHRHLSQNPQRPPRHRRNLMQDRDGRHGERTLQTRLSRARQRRSLSGSVLRLRSPTCVQSAATTTLQKRVHCHASINSAVAAGASISRIKYAMKPNSGSLAWERIAI